MAKKFLTHINLNKNELQNAVIQPLASAPGSPAEGQIYYDTVDDTVYVWADGAWLDLGTSGTGSVATVVAGNNIDVDSTDAANPIVSVEALTVADVSGAAPLASPTFTGTVTLPVGLTGVIRTDTGVVSVDTDVTDIVTAASTTAQGKVELATDAETNTGTDTARAITPSNLEAWTGSAQVTTTGTLTSGNADAIVSNASDTVVGKVELATTAETTTGTDAGRAVTPDGLHDMTSLAGAAWFLDEDNMASDSAVKTVSQQSVKAYVDGIVVGLFDFKGSTDASSNPNYPAASKGDAYVISVAGKIGGASGVNVDIGDVYMATADNAGGTQAGVGASWTVLEHNLVGALLAANNLSDVASASTAFTNIKQAATTAATGVVELATDAETNTGTDTGRAITPSNLEAWEGSANVTTVGTLASGNATAIVDAASTTVSGKSELATAAEAEARTDAVRSVPPLALANFPVKKIFTIGDNSATQIDVTHSLGSKEVITQVRQASDDVVVECDITNFSTTVVRLNFTVAPATNALKVVVMG